MPGFQYLRDMRLGFKLLIAYLLLTVALFSVGGLGAPLPDQAHHPIQHRK